MFGFEQNWNGGYIASPTLSTLAERGPEAVLPLTNPSRMRSILALPPVAKAVGAVAPSFGEATERVFTPTSGQSVSVDQSQVNHIQVVEARDGRQTASDIVRAQRKRRFLGGHTLPVRIGV